MRKAVVIVVVLLVALGPGASAYAQRRASRSRGSVSAANRGSVSRSGNSASWQGRGGSASGSGSASRTESGATGSRQTQTQSGASREVSRDVDQENRSVDTSRSVTTAGGETASRESTTSAEDGRLSREGSASTSTGREAEGQAVAGRNAFGQPTVAGSVSAESGDYAAAARRNPGGGYTTAAAGPYGGRVTTTLPSGYRTTTYHGRNYYAYGGAYYRPYTYRGVHYYYPVPTPYYVYYDDPPVGAIIILVVGVTYLMSQDGSYSKKTTTSDGQVAYQSVPAPEGAQIDVLPAERVLVSVSGTTYYLYANTFYRRVAQGAQEQFVVVTPPAGAVFVAAMPADFEVVQLNSMYFLADGNHYVPYLSADGNEMYVLVDPPPAQTPPTTEARPGAQAQATEPAETSVDAPAPAIRTVAQTLTVPSGTLILVRLQAEVSAQTAQVGDRFQGFLAYDLAADGRMIAAKGARVYGVVAAVDQGGKSLSVTLTDVRAGDQVVAIETQPLTVAGDPAVIPAQTLETFTVAVSFDIQLLTNVTVR